VAVGAPEPAYFVKARKYPYSARQEAQNVMNLIETKNKE